MAPPTTKGKFGDSLFGSRAPGKPDGTGKQSDPVGKTVTPVSVPSSSSAGVSTPAASTPAVSPVGASPPKAPATGAPATGAPATGQSPSSAGTDDIFVKVFGLSSSATSDSKGANGLVTLGSIAITTLIFQGSSLTFGSDVKLADVRAKLASSLKSKQSFRICSDDCSLVPEDITLDAYKKLFRNAAFRNDGGWRVYIASSNEPAASQVSVLSSGVYVLKFIQMGDSPSDAVNVGSLHSSAFKGKNPSAMILSELRRLIGKMSSNPKMHIFCSLDGTAGGDELSIQQYLNLDKDEVHPSDGTPSVIIRYRKADAKVSAAGSKFHGASQEVLAAMEKMKPNLTLTDRSAQELHADTTGFKVQEELRASDIAAQDASPLKYTSQMDEADWDAVLRNCCLLYGWKIDKRTNQVVRATTPAFRLRHKNPVRMPEPADPYPVEGSSKTEGTRAIEPAPGTAPATTAPAAATSTDVVKAGAPSESSTSTSISTPIPEIVKAPTAEDVAAPIPTKLGAIPSYAINDRSNIEVVTITSEFQESMAKNHFSATSVEASVSGGYGGFSAGVTGGVKAENSSGTQAAEKSYSKKMYGNYKFPRVDVFLRPEDLEPTQELRDALDLVRRTKNIGNLRKLYATFGHLFCHSVTLGGCLQTTKYVTGTESTLKTTVKEGFKAEVGVAVSTPFGVGGSMKASHEKQDSQENFNRRMNSSESMAFEATGGNSILAADPPRWCGSVADFNNWRVIDQTELTPIIECFSQMQGYADVRSWFFAAVPKLSEYIVIPDTRIMHVRFRVASQNGGLERITGKKEQAYLAHNPEKALMPIRTSLKYTTTENKIKFQVGPWGPTVDMTTGTTQTEISNYDALFYPYCTRAPILMFPKGKEIGTATDKTFPQSIWRMEIAQGYSLGPDTLICIKSAAIDKAELTLTVYRNAQGVFLPAVSSTDEPCYWRLQRPDGAGSPLSSERYKHGDTVRLTWSFSDQKSGFRDYLDDTYGRRNYKQPPEVKSDTLCLKVPYPRFENPSEEGIGLVLSCATTSEPLVETFRIRSLDGEASKIERNYNLHDLTFRVDPVGNEGKGDSGDYMNVVADAHTEAITGSQTWNNNSMSPFQMALQSASPEAIVANALLGPMAMPFAGLASAIGGIFDLF